MRCWSSPGRSCSERSASSGWPPPRSAGGGGSARARTGSPIAAPGPGGSWSASLRGPPPRRGSSGAARRGGAPAAFVASGAVLLAVFAPALLARVYGPAWLPAVRPLQLLALAAPFYVLDCSQVVFRAMGRPSIDLALEAIRVLIFGVVASTALTYGTPGVAAGILLAATLTGTAKLSVARWMVGARAKVGIWPLSYCLVAAAILMPGMLAVPRLRITIALLFASAMVVR